MSFDLGPIMGIPRPPANLDIVTGNPVLIKFIEECEQITAATGIVFVNMGVLKRCANPQTGKLDPAKFMDWISCRASVTEKCPTTKEGYIDTTFVCRGGPRKPCKRDLSKFKWPEIPPTEKQKNNIGSYHLYYFQTLTYVAEVHEDLVDYITEDTLYKEGDSELMNQARQCNWKNLSDMSINYAIFQKDHKKEYRKAWAEKYTVEEEAKLGAKLQKQKEDYAKLPLKEKYKLYLIFNTIFFITNHTRPVFHYMRHLPHSNRGTFILCTTFIVLSNLLKIAYEAKK
jgi:hypothetical protein